MTQRPHTEFCARGPLIRLGQDINYFLSGRSFRGGSRIGAVATKLFIGTPRGPTVCPTRYGFSLTVDPTSEDTLDRDVYFKGTYEAGTIAVIRGCLGEGDVFVDVGSHIGLMALAASKFVGDRGVVYALEPEAGTFEILKRNVKINGIRNVRAHNIALGSERGKSLIHCDSGARGRASLLRGGHETCKSAEVPVETLDDFVSAHVLSTGAATVRMVKIDVEGWELEVLKGGRGLFSSPGAPILCVEYSMYRPTHDGDPLLIHNFITSINDYHVYKLEKSKERPSKLVKVSAPDQLPRHDNLFCFRPEHLRTISPAMLRGSLKREG